MAGQSPNVTLDDLVGRVGERLGASRWHTVTQEQVQRFADATGDHQWIHLDEDRARNGPFGTTVAHGYLTLALAPALLSEVVQVTDAAVIVNYGLERVRFPAPLPTGSDVRAVAVCEDAAPVGGGIQVRLGVTFERAGEDKPACVAQILFRYYR